MTRILKRHPRNTTGCVGISIARAYRAHRRQRRPHDYFVVRCGSHSTKRFNIDFLGRHEAWRRALKFRAAYELKVQSVVADRRAV